MKRLFLCALLALGMRSYAADAVKATETPFTIRVSAITQLGDVSYVGLIDGSGKSYLIKEGAEDEGFSVVRVDYVKSLVEIAYKGRRFDCQISGDPKKVPISSLADVRAFLDQAGVESKDMRALIESNPDAVIIVNNTLPKPKRSQAVTGFGEGIQSMFSSQELARVQEGRTEMPALTNIGSILTGPEGVITNKLEKAVPTAN